MPILICSLLLLIVSPELLAQTVPSANALSFAPPVSDSSMVYLANIFGTVEGVLASTGSQMFGRMMAVFNMAILALGSIVIMYTLVVGTLNTAHEGEFLGKHWSSIWLPVRCCIGLALLVPKISGYNLIQIFMMWFIVQGVGAADKIWSAALDYMNGGGQLVVPKQSSQSLQSIDDSQGYSVYEGAMVMFTGQVCMEALQRQITQQREIYLNQVNTQTGPCYNPQDQDWKDFCNTSVPDFIGSVNAVDAQMKDKMSGGNYFVNMPNLTDSTPKFYQKLTGACGQLVWAPLEGLNSSTMQDDYGMSQAQTETMQNSRAIAVQQMYEWLSSVAIQMVNNDPQIANSASAATGTQTASSSAISQFGFAIYNNAACVGVSSNCTSWGADSSKTNGSASVLFAGNEFPNAIASYDGVMGPTLNFINETANESTAQALRDFIDQSKSEGWLMAGSYFYNMIALSGSDVSSAMPKDKKSGLNNSTYYSLPASNTACSASPLPNDAAIAICSIFSGKSQGQTGFENANLAGVADVVNLISGLNSWDSSDSNCSTPLQAVSFDATYGYVLATLDTSNNTPFTSTVACASTAFGFIGNSFYVYTPGQTVPTITFPNPANITAAAAPQDMNLGSNSCYNMKFFTISVCIKALSQIMNAVITNLYNWVLKWFFYYVSEAITDALIKPLMNIAWPMLQYALEQLNNQSYSPIVNLGNMGVTLVNYLMVLFLAMMAGLLVSLAFPPAFAIAFAILTMFAPLIASFFALFISIGFICAYYVPLLPYMIFTFGSLGWFMAVIEAMVAGPILALGIMSPEGEGLLGKAEQGMMILVNVFLRPSMMIIGFVVGTILTYVFVWVVGEGYQQAAQYLLAGNCTSGGCPTVSFGTGSAPTNNAGYNAGLKMNVGTFSMIFGAVAYSLIYVYLYQTVVEKSFDLVHLLPDQILRWIGGHNEQYGRETKDWAQGAKEKVQKMEEGGTKAMASSVEGLTGSAKEQIEKDEKQKDKAAKAGGGGGGGGAPPP